MSYPFELGKVIWTRDEIIRAIPEFLELYAERPIVDNQGGMKAPHMFAVWFICRKLNPQLIIESGVYRGQSTWLLEKSCPQAQVVSIDVNLDFREYISSRVDYSNQDFSLHDWSGIDPQNTLAFFDDHQNALTRLQQCLWFGIRHILFDDNYPEQRGDCYSIKKAFLGCGFEPLHSQAYPPKASFRTSLKHRVANLLGLSPIRLTPQYEQVRIPPNVHDAKFLLKNIDSYYEFPPVYQPKLTRWHDTWDDTYPTPPFLLEEESKGLYPLFWEEALYYTWICYVKLKACL